MAANMVAGGTALQHSAFRGSGLKAAPARLGSCNRGSLQVRSFGTCLAERHWRWLLLVGDRGVCHPPIVFDGAANFGNSRP